MLIADTENIREVIAFPKNKKAREKTKAMNEIGRWVDPDTGVVYFDSSRWCSPTKMRKYC